MPEELTTTSGVQIDPALEERYRAMVEAGVLYGRKKSSTHPKMKPNIMGDRNGIEIVNLMYTVEVMDRAVAFLKDIAARGGLVLFVATQPAAEEARDVAAEFNAPVVLRRWLGGLLTNFKILSTRIEYFKKLKEDWKNNAFEKYTKKERVVIEKEMNRMAEVMTGLEPLTRRPDALVIVDANVHRTAIREAKHQGIPVIAFVNTDTDPRGIAYPVLGNNKAKSSIHWFLDHAAAALREGKALYAVNAVAAAQAAEANKTKEINNANEAARE